MPKSLAHRTNETCGRKFEKVLVPVLTRVLDFSCQAVSTTTKELQMARIAKSKDTANYRKGKDLRVGDKLAVDWEGTTPTAYSPIVSIERVEYMGAGRNYRAVTECGFSGTFAGGEFAEGQYA